MNLSLRVHRSRVAILPVVVLASFVMVLCGSRVAQAGPAVAALNGDANGDSLRDTADAVYLLSWLFLAGPAPVELQVAGAPAEILNGDCNGDSARDVADCLYLLFFLYSGGPEPVSPEPPAMTTYRGALPASRGRWSYGGIVGLEGAIFLCNENFPGTSVCTREQLLVAEESGELLDAVDIDGDPVASFWIHDPDAAGDRQCIHPGAENINWTYNTGHLPSHGEYVSLDDEGSLSDILLQNHCAGSHWVPCCADEGEPPAEPMEVEEAEEAQ